MAGHGGKSVRMEPGTRDEVAGSHRAAGRLEDQPTVPLVNRGHLRPSTDLGAACPQLVGEGEREAPPVDYSGGGHVESAEPDDLRLDLAHRLGSQLADVGPVRPRLLRDRGKPRQFHRSRRNDQLPADLVRDAMGVGECQSRVHPLAAEARLERARHVRVRGVDDATVAAGLVLGELRLLFEEHEPECGSSFKEAVSSGEADDPAPDYHEIGSNIHAHARVGRCAEGPAFMRSAAALGGIRYKRSEGLGPGTGEAFEMCISWRSVPPRGFALRIAARPPRSDIPCCHWQTTAQLAGPGRDPLQWERGQDVPHLSAVDLLRVQRQ